MIFFSLIFENHSSFDEKSCQHCMVKYTVKPTRLKKPTVKRPALGHYRVFEIERKHTDISWHCPSKRIIYRNLELWRGF